MAILSTLRTPAAKDRFERFAKSYAAHRPAVQRVLNISFVFYVLGTTYLSISSGSGKKGDSGGKKGRGKSKKGETGKPPKVAVSTNVEITESLALISAMAFAGRWYILCTTGAYP